VTGHESGAAPAKLSPNKSHQEQPRDGRVADPLCPHCRGTGIFGGPGSYYDAPGKGKPCDCVDGAA
jgi:hypothetical protein